MSILQNLKECLKKEDETNFQYDNNVKNVFFPSFIKYKIHVNKSFKEKIHQSPYKMEEIMSLKTFTSYLGIQKIQLSE